jgi:signal transduction histidine kinase
MSRRASPAGDRRLIPFVVCGLLAGGAFVAFDLYSESMIGAGTMTERHAGLHLVVDHVLPLVVGPLLGVAAHYVFLRSRLSAAEDAAARADALRMRLHKVERDQALWVLIAAVLHELNNPLHALRLLLDELGREHGDEAHADLVRRAHSQAERMLTQLERLRSLRGMSEPQLESVDLEDVIASITSDAHALAAEEGLGVRLRTERPVTALVDPAYVRTIVENLVDNSLHALRQQGQGLITVELGAENERAIVRVSDDGPELDARARTQLFEPLSSTKENGLGLGLAIARALARAMGGELLLEPTLPKAFRLELPLGRP